MGNTFLMWRGWMPVVASAELEGTPFIISAWRNITSPKQNKKKKGAKAILCEHGDFYKPDFVASNPFVYKLFGNSLLSSPFFSAFGRWHLTRVPCYCTKGKSLLGVSGDEWKRQRRTMDPAFKYKKLKTLVPVFAQVTDKLLRYKKYPPPESPYLTCAPPKKYNGNGSNWDDACDKGPVAIEEGITALALDVLGSYNANIAPFISYRPFTC